MDRNNVSDLQLDEAEVFIEKGIREKDAFFEKLVSLCKGQNIHKLIRAYYLHAYYRCRVTADYNATVQICKEALKHQHIDASPFYYASILRVYGVATFYLGDFETSQINYLQAIAILEAELKPDRKILSELAMLYYNMAVLLKSSDPGDYPIQYVDAAMALMEQLADKQGIAKCYNLYANYSAEKGSVEEALNFQKQAEKVFEEIGDIYHLSIIKNNRGLTLCESGKFEEGIIELKESLKMKQQLDNPQLISASLMHLGVAYMQQERFKEALNYLLEAEEMLLNRKNKTKLHILYKHISECFAAIENYEAACDYHVKYDKLYDEVYNFSKSAALVAAQSRFELDKKKKEAELLRLKNKEIEEYARQLQLTNDELKQFTHVASHDLKVPLRMITNYISLIEKKASGIKEKRAAEYLSYLKEGGQRMQMLITSLSVMSRLNEEIPLSEFELSNLVREAFYNARNITNQPTAVLSVVGQLPTLRAKKHHINMLFDELFTNALKFNKNVTPEIQLTLIQEDDKLEFRVADNGIGISEKHREKVFMIFQRLNHRELYEGTGAGLTICRKIVEDLNGTISVEKSDENGTVFLIVLPDSLLA